MRRRLLFSTLAVAVTAVVLFGLPLAFVLKQLQVAYAQDLVQRDATTVARILQNRLSSGLPVAPLDIANAADAARSLPDRYVRIYQNGGGYTHFGSQLPKGSAIVAHAVTNNFRVTVEADKSVETAGVSEKLALIISLAALAVAVAVALAMVQARRRCRRPNGSPTWSASCSGVLTALPRVPRNWFVSMTSWPSRWWSGIRHSGARTASWRWWGRRASPRT